MAKILVTGGCGYIGSHTVVDLQEHGYEVVVVDNLSNADSGVVRGICQITGKKPVFCQVDLRDRTALTEVFSNHPDIQGVIHFAAFKMVGESVKRPLEYYDNNIGGLINLLFCMRDFGVNSLIFSSSCTVYGNTAELPVTEQTPLQDAASPYGYTKQVGERMITDLVAANPDMKAVLLRYFNPAGAHESGKIGEDARIVAQNLVPVITETAIGKRLSLQVFGNDYATRDGSCIRDYIHIMDLARAHTLALEYQLNNRQQEPIVAFNLGIGEGVTVLEAIEAFERVTSQSLNYQIGPRRAGDVEAIYADYSKARQLLGWHPQRSIDDIMQSAWIWEKVRTEQETS